MNTVRVKLDGSNKPAAYPAGRIDARRVDATTQAGINSQQAQDEAEALKDAASYAKGVRKRLGLSQAEFSACIGVPLDTIRNWEQGKRGPTGAARALLRVLDKIPEAALAVLR